MLSEVGVEEVAFYFEQHHTVFCCLLQNHCAKLSLLSQRMVCKKKEMCLCYYMCCKYCYVIML